jgi:GDP-L-fucose synthase
MEKTSKIYIAGHNGMVGSSITRKLISEGFTNLVFTPFPPYDLTDQKTVSDFFLVEKPEYVFLAAAKVGGILSNNKYRAQFIYENIMIQNNVIHQSYLNGVKKLLFLGSSCIYPKNCLQPIKEEYLLTGELEYTNEPYAVAKIAGIKMCESYNSQYGTNFISIMPTNLYGPNDNFNLETSHVLPALIRKMHLGKSFENNNWNAVRKDLKKYPVDGLNENSPENLIIEKLNKYGIKYSSDLPSKTVKITLWGTGSPYREFLHVDDMADASIFLMKKTNISDIVSLCEVQPNNSSILLSDKKNKHVNVGSGADQTIAELAVIIKDIIGFTGLLEWDSTKPDGTFRKLLDVTKINNLGWRQQIELKDGIEMVYNEYIN